MTEKSIKVTGLGLIVLGMIAYYAPLCILGITAVLFSISLRNYR